MSSLHAILVGNPEAGCGESIDAFQADMENSLD